MRKIYKAGIHVDTLSVDDDIFNEKWTDHDSINDNFRIIDIDNLLGAQIIRWSTGLVEKWECTGGRYSIKRLLVYQ